MSIKKDSNRIITFRDQDIHKLLWKYKENAKKSLDKVQYKDLDMIEKHLVHVENQADKYYRKSFGQALTIAHQEERLTKLHERSLSSDTPRLRRQPHGHKK